MKKLALISVCVLGLAFAGSAATTSSKTNQTPAKKEVAVVKHKKAPAKKMEAKTVGAKPVTPASQVKPATPVKK